MPQQTVVYTVNLTIGAIVAGLMSQHWRIESDVVPLRYWIVAAWTLTAATSSRTPQHGAFCLRLSP